MPWYRIAGDTMAHVRMTNTPKRPAPLQCRALRVWGDGKTRRCCAMSTRLCDWPMDGGETCSMPLCPEHTTSVGADRDFCPVHAPRGSHD